MAIYVTAEDYLLEAETKFRKFKRDWEAFTREAPGKFMNLVKSGFRPSVSRSSSSNRQIGITLSFESNMDAAKKYLEEVKVKIDEKSKEIEENIRDFDENLEIYYDEGIDSDMLTELVEHMNEWIAYIPKMSFKMGGDRTITFSASNDIVEIKKKWEKISAEEARKKEAEIYGVSLEDLDTHKEYLYAKRQKRLAQTSAEMKKAEDAFAAIKYYLDARDLAEACAIEAAELKVKEEEEARIKRELEEARRREEAERLRKAVEAYEKEVAAVTKARENYIAAETKRIEESHKASMNELKTGYETSCEKNKAATEAATAEKTQLEHELETAGLFAFGKKKQLRADIEVLEEKLRQLTNEKRELDTNYEDAKKEQKNALESALKALSKNASEKYVLPKDPRE